MLSGPHVPRSQLLVGCLVSFIAMTWAGGFQHSARRTPVDLFGVEKQVPLDRKYDQEWLEELQRRHRRIQKHSEPFVYASKGEMLQKALQLLKPNECIRELNLYGHGTPGTFTMGKGQTGGYQICTYINIQDPSNVREWKEALKDLPSYFCSKDSMLTLNGCLIGGGEPGAKLVFELSRFLGVRVRAPLGSVWSGYDYDKDWQTADPSMTTPPAPLPIDDDLTEPGLNTPRIRPQRNRR